MFVLRYEPTCNCSPLMAVVRAFEQTYHNVTASSRLNNSFMILPYEKTPLHFGLAERSLYGGVQTPVCHSAGRFAIARDMYFQSKMESNRTPRRAFDV